MNLYFPPFDLQPNSDDPLTEKFFDYIFEGIIEQLRKDIQLLETNHTETDDILILKVPNTKSLSK